MTATLFLLLRVTIGLGLAAHGVQKAFGWWQGGGYSGTVAMTRKMRFRAPGAFALSLIAGELGGGLGLAVGLLTPIAAIGAISSMAMAIILAHLKSGFFASKHGWEVALLYAVGALYIGVAGPGTLSLDRLLGIRIPDVVTAIVAIVVCAIATAGLATRHQLEESRTPSTA